ncbi:MAG TPA: AMP-binding protein [Terriglobales bacterium]|nr:AMP-binding protein [Terriglobales bacterium]
MPRGSILEYLENFYTHGRETAYAQRRGYRTERWSYRQVADLAAQFARELEARAVAKGDRVLLWSENSAQWIAAFFGCLLRGAVVVPMDRIAAPEFAQRVAQQVGAKLALCSADLIKHFPAIPTLEMESLPEMVAEHSAERYAWRDIGRSDTVEIIFTSGATAEPKGVVITHGNILANLESFEPEIAKYRRYERPFHPIRFLNLLPLSHVFGQFLGIFIPQLIGGTVIFQESLGPSEIVRTIKSERVSVLVAVPRLLQSLKEKIERDCEARGELERFRRELERSAKLHFATRWWMFRRVHRQFGLKFWALISGGATLDRATEEFWRRLGFVVIQGYGLTETTSLISVNHPFRLGKGSIGKVLPGREMKLSPEGEILVRGENVASGYWQGDRLTPVASDAGWFHTGDLGELDAEGNLYFKGRSKQVIVNPEGLKIFPEDLEAALRQQPEVRDCLVFPLERNGNSEACAAIIARSLENAEQAVAKAVAAANQKLATHQQIRKWLVWPELDFPRTNTQKIRSNVVKEFAEARFGAGASEPQHATSPLQQMIARIRGERAPVSASAASELNLSSLDRVELMSALEDRYEVDLNDQSFAEARTVGQLEQALQQAAPRQSEYAYPRWAQRWPVTWMRTLVYYLAVWPATMLLAKPGVSGRENLRGVKGPMLMISNHATYIDVGFILAALPVRLRAQLATAMGGEMLFAMRRPPREMFFLRRWLERLNYALVVALFNVFPLPQRSGFRDSFAFAGSLVDRGYSVLVFPEGARTPDGKLHAFRGGIGLLASRLSVPVLPVKIEGLYEVKGKHLVPPGKIKVRIGAPVSFPPNSDPDQITRELEARVAAL